jgi:hypothetical protein
MHGAYDNTFSHMHSNSDAFIKAQNRILRLIKYNTRVTKLNLQFLRRTIDYPKKTSRVIRQELCTQCPEDTEVCEEGRDDHRRYYCKTLSNRTGNYVRLYLPKFDDSENQKDRLKKRITQAIARNPGLSQTKIAGAVRGDKRLVRDCLNELNARGIIQCNERIEKGNMVKRYKIIFD